MKNAVLALFFSAVSMLHAQISITSPYLTYAVSPSDFEVVAKCTVKNESGMGQNVTWKREIDCMTTGWKAMVCDANACWSPSVESKTFNLAAGDTTFLDLHVQPAELVGGAIIKMKVFFTNDTNIKDDIELKFNVSACTSSSVDINGTTVTIFPNPAAHFFGLTSLPSAVKGIRLVDVQGRQVAAFTTDAAHRYDIAHLTAGSYHVFLLDDTHRILGVLPLVK